MNNIKPHILFCNPKDFPMVSNCVAIAKRDKDISVISSDLVECGKAYLMNRADICLFDEYKTESEVKE